MMKHGLPVVVAAAPGLRELYTHGENALIVPLRKTDNNLMKLELNEEKLTESLAKALKDDDLRQKLSINARSDWEQNYTANRMGNATINQYKLLLSRTKKEDTNKYKIQNQ